MAVHRLMKSRACPKIATFSPSHYDEKGFLPRTKSSKSLHHSLPQAVYFRYQETYFRIGNLNFVLLPTVQNQKCTNPSKLYFQHLSLFYTTHQLTIGFHVLQQQLLCGQVSSCPCVPVFLCLLSTPWLTGRFHKFRFVSSSSSSLPVKIYITGSYMVCKGCTKIMVAAPVLSAPLSGFSKHPKIHRAMFRRDEIAQLFSQ